MGGGVMEKNTIATRIFQLLGGDLAPKNYIFFCLDMFGFVFYFFFCLHSFSQTKKLTASNYLGGLVASV